MPTFPVASLDELDDLIQRVEGERGEQESTTQQLVQDHLNVVCSQKWIWGITFIVFSSQII
jgi:hypothetical protein